MAFPYDFGFVPSTKAEDGDPVDVLVLMDEPAFPGCLLECRVIGIIEGEQRSKQKKIRNDRVVAVECSDHDFADIYHVRRLGRGSSESWRNFSSTITLSREANFACSK